MAHYEYTEENKYQGPNWAQETSQFTSNSYFDPMYPTSESNNWDTNISRHNRVIHGGGDYANEGSFGSYSLSSSANPPAVAAATNVTNHGCPIYQDTWEGRITDKKHTLGRAEEVEDVSTWSLDTIKEVASDLHQASQCGHHQAVSGPTNSSPLLLQGHNNSLIPNWGATSEPELEPVNSWNLTNSDSPGGEVLSQPGGILNPGSQEPMRRKLKMYQWPPQQDPKMEKKRLRAIKQFKKRLEEEQEERQLKRCLADTTRELPSLRQQVLSYHQKVDDLEYQLANSLTLSRQHDH